MPNVKLAAATEPIRNAATDQPVEAVAAWRKERKRLVALRPALELRARVIAGLRDLLEQKGSLEVETPMRVAAPGTDPHLDPEPSGDRYLITSPEFHMKRLVAAGYDRTHQICRCFRQGEQGQHHNPEFTMLEWYWAGVEYQTFARELEGIISTLAQNVLGGTTLPGRAIQLAPPWEWLTVDEAFRRHAGWSPGPAPDPERFFRDLVERIEPRLGRERPTILLEYPASQAALSRLDPENPDVALRFEVYVDGIELANAFDELTDGQVQQARFASDLDARRRGGKPLLPADEGLVAALDTMPPTTGAALGVDRLVMLFIGKKDLASVVAFPDTGA